MDGKKDTKTETENGRETRNKRLTVRLERGVESGSGGQGGVGRRTGGAVWRIRKTRNDCCCLYTPVIIKMCDNTKGYTVLFSVTLPRRDAVARSLPVHFLLNLGVRRSSAPSSAASLQAQARSPHTPIKPRLFRHHKLPKYSGRHFHRLFPCHFAFMCTYSPLHALHPCTTARTSLAFSVTAFHSRIPSTEAHSRIPIPSSVRKFISSMV